MEEKKEGIGEEKSRAHFQANYDQRTPVAEYVFHAAGSTINHPLIPHLSSHQPSHFLTHVPAPIFYSNYYIRFRLVYKK